MKGHPIAMLAALTTLISGCGSDGAPAATTEAVTDGGSYLVMYSPDPNPIPLNESFSVTAMVHDNADTTSMITDATVTINATMPEHGHGMNTEPVTTSNGDGTYTSEGLLFHMEGNWELTVDVTVADTTEQAVFEVDCCEE